MLFDTSCTYKHLIETDLAVSASTHKLIVSSTWSPTLILRAWLTRWDSQSFPSLLDSLQKCVCSYSQDSSLRFPCSSKCRQGIRLTFGTLWRVWRLQHHQLARYRLLKTQHTLCSGEVSLTNVSHTLASASPGLKRLYAATKCGLETLKMRI